MNETGGKGAAGAREVTEDVEMAITGCVVPLEMVGVLLAGGV